MNRTPVVFIHGAWLHALSWEAWAERFASRGYLAFAPGWPGETATAQDVRASPGLLGSLGLDALTDHYAAIIRSFDVPPVVVGHSVGGLIAQHLISINVGRAAVAISAAPINDVALPAVPAHPCSCDSTVHLASLTPQQFHHVYANTVTTAESDRLFERYAIPTPRRLLAELGSTDPVRSPCAVADVANTGRGPLLLVSGQEDRLVPDSVTREVYKEYGDSTAVTDLKQFADRGHSLVIDSGWRLVADYVLGWLDEQGVRSLPAKS
ncbi:alpha/beta hydrolase [Streptomyces dioscori]|uniref:Alpha/beta hydrolase n=1 Tax=Streptomyces dioscori TaxID=2109333 RepID=A0A2P8Q9J1_9ACTN|nr:alpha/beta fold hydrolase [Streptomyces dioscori]PSM42905.1 alpha/beta hydrolase [Streptomyces dioscori]